MIREALGLPLFWITVRAPLQTTRPSESQLLKDGLALHAKGRFLEAEARYQAILARNPKHAEANNGMGALSVAAEKLDFAIGFFERAVAAKPNEFRFLNNLGNVFMDLGRTEEGLPYLERALKLQPSSYELNYNIGRAYQKMGIAARGASYLERAVSMRPESAEAAFALAEMLSTMGNNEGAERQYRRAEALGSPVASVLMGISAVRRQTPESNILSEVEDALAGPSVSGPAGISAITQLHFAAAKTLMDLKDANRAWPHLAAANEGAKPFDMARYVADIDALIALFNPTFMAAHHTFGSSSERPVFIVGMPRSGTSLTEQILSSHSDVVGAGELTYMHTIANRLFYSLSVRELFRDQVRALTPERATALATEYLRKIEFFSTTSARITDKMPHNYHLVGLIALLFSKARIVYCRRDPMDNCFSIYSNALNEFHSYGADLSTLGAYYRQHIRLMEHWTQLLPDRIFEMRYEDLIGDLEGKSRQLVDFAGLPWDPACLQFFETERTVATISKWQVRQPLYTTSIARWKPYEQYLGPLKEALGPLTT
jgi:Tfp pilus assembly protein PilF